MNGVISVKRLSKRIKQAELPTPSNDYNPDAAFASKSVDMNNQLKQDALKSVGRALIAGLGIGAGARGLMGLSQLTTKNLMPERRVGSNATIASMPVPIIEDDEDDEEENRLRKRAEDALDSQPSGSGLFLPNRGPEPKRFDVNGEPTSRWDTWNNWQKPNRGLKGFIFGDDASTPSGIPLYWPSLGLAAGGGLFGGYKLVDHFLGKRKKQLTEEQLTEAKQRYRNALLAQYDPEQVEKWSEVNVESGLDLLFDRMVKKTEGHLEKLADLANTSGQVLGALGLGAGALAIGSGIASYKYTKSRSPEERLKKVIQQRERERWLRRPPEIYAIPTPLPVKPEEEDEDNQDELTNKVAAFVTGLFE